MGGADIPVHPRSVSLAGGGTGAAATATINNGHVTAINLTSGGSGYTYSPSVGISGNGSGAMAIALFTPAAIASLVLTYGGSSYTSNPSITISGGGGTGATATASLTSTWVQGLTLTNGGSGYTSAPSVTISGGGGSGAADTANLAGRSISSITLTNGGSGYTSTPGVSFAGGGGSGAVAAAVLGSASVASITLTNGGSGYSSNPSVNFSGGGGSGAAATAYLTPTSVASLTLTNGGSGYTTVPTVTISGGGGSGAAGTATLPARAVGSVSVTNGGSGYTSAPTVTFSGGGGSGAVATATLASRSVSSITLTNGGSGYTSLPSIGFTGGGGSGAVATASLNATPVGNINVTSGGSGYSSAPTMGFSGGGGSGAVASATLTPANVASISLNNAGSGYTTVPTVNFSGGGGSGASATATLVPVAIGGLTITSVGSGYTSVPVIGFSGGGGSGATANATITPDSQSLSWDVENRPSSVTTNGVIINYTYDGDGNRVKQQLVSGNITIYVNQYYEKTGSIVTTHYFLGSKQIAVSVNGTLSYLMQDSLGSTSVMTDTNGDWSGTIRYLPFGGSRNSTGTIPTNELFTGQRLDSTGLYYYGARYYDSSIGRFVSPDSAIPDASNPQGLNRYSYCINNPLKYTDPTGMYFSTTYPWTIPMDMAFAYGYVDPIESAYQAIMGSSDVSQWIKDYMQTLHSSDRAVNIDFGNIGGEGIALNAMQISPRLGGPTITTEDTIILDNAWLTGSQAGLASGFAHECYHIFEGNPGATIQEEFTAYAAEFFVGRGLGWDYVKQGNLDWLWNTAGGLGSDELLTGIQLHLKGGGGNSSNVYASMPWRQSDMNTLQLVRQGIFAANLPVWSWISSGLGYGLGGVLTVSFTVQGIPWK